MADFDYKKYSLEQLENWIYDSLSAAEASPQEIYDVIKKTVEEQYYCYKNHTSRAYELLALLNGNGKGHIKAYDDCVDKVLSCDKNNSSPECKGAWNSFWEETGYPEEVLNAMCDEAEKKNLTYDEAIAAGHEMTADGFWIPPQKEDKVTKWQLPVEMHPSGEYYVLFPDDLLGAANLEEGDTVEWISNDDGSYLLKKVVK